MRHILLAVLGQLSLGLVAATPREAVNQPCSQISELYTAAAEKDSISDLVLDGELAHQCLQLMPFDSDRGAEFIVELKKYIQWHSTVDVLKNPPPEYLSPATDLLGGLDELHANSISGEFASQFEFDTAIVQLFNSANDQHLSIELCSQGIFGFTTPLPIVSISEDGVQLPQIFAYEDTENLVHDPEHVSPIVSIEGRDAISYLKELGLTQTYQDPDAQYNAVFQSPSKRFSGGSADGAWTWNNGLWPGRSHYTVAFANGTTREVGVTATILQDGKFDYQNGQSLFEAFCVPKPQDLVTEGGSQDDSKSSEPAPPTYPTPEMRHPKNMISGYYLNQTDLRNVAVLAVPSFDPGDAGVFADNATEFIESAVAAGKQKLVIDLSGNGGGSLNVGFDLFKLFFPEKPVYSATRFRAHESANLIVQAVAGLTEDDEEYEDVEDLAVSGAVSPNQTYQFRSWPEMYGPHYQFGANMTSLLANFNFTRWSSDGNLPIRGYGQVKVNRTSPPFAPENILLVTDGFCGSTCTTFAELMKNLAGVKSLAFGGRPQHAPMQALGGVKGGQSASGDLLMGYVTGAQEVVRKSAKSSEPVLTEEQFERLNETSPTQDLPLNMSSISVNLRNAYRPGEDMIPLQFIYETADCRLFYTLENVFHAETSWAAAARAFWGDGTCVKYSTPTTNSTFPYYPSSSPVPSSPPLDPSPFEGSVGTAKVPILFTIITAFLSVFYL